MLVYQERVGSRLGADPPAAVGFEVKLVASDGMVLWEGNYYEKQRPMTEDFVGFIQRSGCLSLRMSWQPMEPPNWPTSFPTVAQGRRTS